MEWIKLEKARPDKDCCCLCLLSIKPFVNENLSDEEQQEQKDNFLINICNYYNGEDGYFHHRTVCYEVVYWMALPTFPVLENDED